MTVVYLTTASSTPWTVPADWNNSANTIEVIGGGGGGATSVFTTTSGGGGGAYSKVSNLTLSGTALFTVGLGGAAGVAGGDTFFNAATLGASSVGAKGGGAGTISPNPNSTAGAGGAAASGVGTTKHSGGDGGTGAAGNGGGSGGGGAAGPTGDGAHGGIGSVGGASAGGGGGGADGGSAGGDASSSTGGTAGAGANNGGSGGAGKNGTSGSGVTPNPGGAGTEFDASHGSGGGGGACGYSNNAGAGGLYGGGGGAGSYSSGVGGAGANGLIVITYTPAASGPLPVDEDARCLPPRRPPHFCQPAEPAPIYWPYKQSALQTNGGSSSTTVVASFPNKVGASLGGLILATISWSGSSGDTVSLTDDQGNVYVQPPGLAQFNVGLSTWWIGAYCAAPAGNPQTLTATISTSRTFGRLVVDEFSGYWAYRDQAASNSQTGVAAGTDTVISPSVTPQANRELAYGSTVKLGGGTLTSATGTGWNQATNYFDFATEFLVQSAATTATATWSPASTPTGATYLTYIATFSQAQVQLAVPEAVGQLAPLRRPVQRFAVQSEVGLPPTAAVVSPRPLEQEQQKLPPRRPGHLAQEAETAPVSPPQVRVAPEETRLPIGRSWHRLADVDQGGWPFTAVATVGRLVAEEPGRLPPRRPTHASPAQDELNAIFASAPVVFKPIGEDDHHLPPRRPWHRMGELDQGAWPFTVVATVGRLVAEEPGRLPPRRPYHRTPDVDQGAWPFSVLPLNTATYLPEDEQHRPRQRPWHSMLTAHADLQVPPPAPTSLFYAYGQAGARSVG